MSRRSSASAGLLALSLAIAHPDEVPAIRLNTLGYLPDTAKRASVTAPCTDFAVVRVADGVRVFEGRVSGPVPNADTREELYTADFSAFDAEGVYRVHVAGIGFSAPFQISPEVYWAPFRTVTRAMYLWRCGTAVSGSHGGNLFTHAACHTNDASLKYVRDDNGHKDGTRGWHDAGDYNKYVVNAGISVGAMIRAWEDFGGAIQPIPLDLPDSGSGVPDFLAELKWELDWLLTMQAPDGSVYHKLSTPDFGGFIPPEDEDQTRYFVPWSSAATADFVAMMAAAARCFREVDAAYAERCLQAARRSYAFLESHPADHPADLSGFTTGGYQTHDEDDRLWAAAELWESTGDPGALNDFERRARQTGGRVETDWDWGNVGNLGLITYAFSTRSGRDSSLVAAIRSNLVTVADGIVETRDHHGYERPLGTRYYWGCNGSVARQAIVLRAAFREQPRAEYRAACLDAMNHLFGRNAYGRSFITGLGDRPPIRPHDRRSGADDVLAPWPGYLVGGPNRGALSWEDEEANYRCNEIAINWNAALIYALAACLDESDWGPPAASAPSRSAAHPFVTSRHAPDAARQPEVSR